MLWARRQEWSNVRHHWECFEVRAGLLLPLYLKGERDYEKRLRNKNWFWYLNSLKLWWGGCRTLWSEWDRYCLHTSNGSSDNNHLLNAAATVLGCACPSWIRADANVGWLVPSTDKWCRWPHRVLLEVCCSQKDDHLDDHSLSKVCCCLRH